MDGDDMPGEIILGKNLHHEIVCGGFRTPTKYIRADAIKEILTKHRDYRRYAPFVEIAELVGWEDADG